MKVVTVALLVNNGQILIAKRKGNGRLPHKWEFPGGKIEVGETPEASLIREMNEELNIEVAVGDYYCDSNYTYAHGKVRLLAYWTHWLDRDIIMTVHEEIKWVPLKQVADLELLDFAPADVMIIKKLKNDIAKGYINVFSIDRSPNQEYLKCLSLLKEDEIVSLLSDLVKIKSCPPDFNEKDVAVVVAKKFSEYGIESVIDDLDEPNRANLIAGIGSKNRPNLVYGGHFDTVPPVEKGWKYGPFDATIEDGILYGRGACDMKGGVAAMVMAMCYLKKAGVKLNGRLTFLGTAGEEVGCYGAKAYNKKYGCEDIDALAISEATNKLMSLGEKGALWIKFITHGRAAHPGVSWEGVNSLLNMLKFFEEFRKYEFSVENHEFFGAPTLNITTMHAGDITNALPIRCEATVDIRTVPGINHQDIIEYVESIISDMKAKDKDFVMEYQIINDIKLIETDKKSPLVETAFKTHEEVLGRSVEPTGVFYFTDAIALEKSEPIPLIIYGPGNPKNNHKVNEPVPISEVIDVTKFYIGLAINYLK